MVQVPSPYAGQKGPPGVPEMIEIVTPNGKEIRREAVEAYIERGDWSTKATAKVLGISRASLYKLIGKGALKYKVPGVIDPRTVCEYLDKHTYDILDEESKK